MILFLMVSIAGCMSSPVPKHQRWQLVYAHDKDGNSVEGNKAELIKLVESGHPVRIFWPIRTGFAHALDANFLTISGGEVFAQSDNIIRQIPERPSYKRIALDASEQSKWHAIFSTTGELRSFQSKEKKLASHQFPLHWFVYY